MDILEEKDLEQVSGGGEWEPPKPCYIDQGMCIRCGSCVSACPFGAISENGDNYSIDSITCGGCGECKSSCSTGAII